MLSKQKDVINYHVIKKVVKFGKKMTIIPIGGNTDLAICIPNKFWNELYESVGIVKQFEYQVMKSVFNKDLGDYEQSSMIVSGEELIKYIDSLKGSFLQKKSSIKNPVLF